MKILYEVSIRGGDDVFSHKSKDWIIAIYSVEDILFFWWNKRIYVIMSGII